MRISKWRAMVALTVLTAMCLVATPGNAQSDRGQPMRADDTAATGDGGAQLSAADGSLLANAPDSRPLRVLLAAEVGEGDEVVDLVRRSGGSIWRASDRAGFVIADLTPGQVRAIDGSPLLKEIALDQKINIPIESPEFGLDGRSAGATHLEGDRPLVATGATATTTPYSPIGDIGAPQFINKHPTRDGRGVVLGVVDLGFDPSTPGLQTTSTGEPKVLRAYNLTGDVRNVVTDRTVQVHVGLITVDGQTFTAPAGVTNGKLRYGELREERISFSPYDLNRDGDSTDAFPAVVAGATRQDLTIWFDTDQDGSFADETELRDWNTTREHARLGQDDPDTAHIEEVTSFGVNLCQETGAVPCVTRADRLGDVWDIVTDLTGHGTAATSIAAGNDMRAFGQSFDGVAPGAQVISLTAGDHLGPGFDYPLVFSQFAAALLLGAEQGVDVLSCSCQLLLLFDRPAAEAVTQLVENLIASYGVAVAVGAGNNIWLAAAYSSPQMVDDAIEVGASITPTTFERNYLRPGISGDGVAYYSTPGPIADGGYHPDVLAPTSLLTAVPTWVSGQSGGTSYPAQQFPPGYRIFGGTSASTPVVAGALADLLSAARAEGVTQTAHTLKRALELSGRPLRTTHPYQVVEVGHGVVQIDEAWMWLKRLGAEGAIDRDVDTVVDSEFFGEGQGIYQRNFFNPTEHVTLTTDSNQAHSYQLRASERWIRLDRNQIRLRGNSSEAFTVHLDPKLVDEPGVHSGVVTVDDPTTMDPADHEMMVVVVTPTPLDENNQLHVTGSGKAGIDAEKVRTFFFRVPSGATSLELQSTTPASASAGVWAGIAEPGPEVLDRALLTDPGTGKSNSAVIDNPRPGVWELWLYASESNRIGQPVLPNHPYDVTVTVGGQ